MQVDDEFKIISDAYPYIASRLLTDPSVELQAALEQVRGTIRINMGEQNRSLSPGPFRLLLSFMCVCLLQYFSPLFSLFSSTLSIFLSVVV